MQKLGGLKLFTNFAPMKKFIALLKDKERLYNIVFNSDTKAGKAFDISVMIAIVLSLIVAFIETKPAVMGRFKDVLTILEYILTFFFTIEYILRLYCSPRPKDYALSFFGVIDLLATLPLYLSFIPCLSSARYFFIVRVFRLIRIFRVLKLFAFINEGYLLLQSIRLSLRKILVYFLFVLILVTIIGTLMFIVEGNQPGTQFTDIGTSIYWAIVTLTTVGYGDITPVTLVGRLLSSIVMILGYTIIAVPTGIVSATMIDEPNARARTVAALVATKKQISKPTTARTVEKDYKLYVLDNLAAITSDELEAAIASLPDWRREKALRFKHEQGRKECTYAYLLLCQALQETYGINEQPSFLIGEHGKPELSFVQGGSPASSSSHLSPLTSHLSPLHFNLF